MSHETPVQPKLSELLAGYLHRRSGAHVEGLANLDVHPEVLPYDAGPLQPIDAVQAWQETLFVPILFGVDTTSWKVPPQWPNLVSAHEPAVALTCATGNFPQLVRHFHTILQAPSLSELRGTVSSTAPPAGLLEWAQQSARKATSSQMLLVVGTLRLAKQFDEAQRFMESNEPNVSSDVRAAWENERAALAWHAGDTEKAVELWQQLEPAAPVLFNRGMANLFLDRGDEARSPLSQAVERFPENGAWHHLGRLYLTLAQGS